MQMRFLRSSYRHEFVTTGVSCLDRSFINSTTCLSKLYSPFGNPACGRIILLSHTRGLNDIQIDLHSQFCDSKIARDHFSDAVCESSPLAPSLPLFPAFYLSFHLSCSLCLTCIGVQEGQDRLRNDGGPRQLKQSQYKCSAGDLFTEW